ncbi:SAM-dependent methyltransferase (plasmid) [Deinococcus sp. KNUC1210]|uniref:N-6 DNA methylase n=1 Tax=Deinococcus sp. KNUC1210 TaxID=2917691 RepID=UPI001EF0E701|nr:N-6 DNA methylase [Deinococcus sp. KNUC1210]ULH17428.1 SAM-dependent methyltransferase [Deinococcus sp. KNUC1210]
MSIDAERLPWVKLLKKVAPQNRDLMQTFRTFVGAAACAVAAGQREDEYLDIIKGWSREDLTPFGHVLGQLVLDMEKYEYTDILGPAYEAFESQSARQRTGSFYTPDSVAYLVARLATQGMQWPERGPLGIHEPAGGSGAMLLAAVREFRQQGAPPQSIRIQTWDINKLACDMVFLNLTLHGVPAEVVHGDTLRYEKWSVWRNVWYYAAHGWQREAA